MARKPASFTFDDRLNEQRARLTAQFDNAADPVERDNIQRKLHQLDTARDINDWLSASSLKAPG